MTAGQSLREYTKRNSVVAGSALTPTPVPCSRLRTHRSSRSRGKRITPPILSAGMLGSWVAHRYTDFSDTWSHRATCMAVR
jgi:hypothetical protein